MVNKSLFPTSRESRIKKADTRNKAGGRAYKMSDEEALCQYVVTSTFGGAYYVTAKEQLSELKSIVDRTDSTMIAKAAVYAAEIGKMKDTPAYLLAVLAARGELDLLRATFKRVCKSPKMLLNFVRIVRSGVTGRRSLGSGPQKLVRDWINSRRGNSLYEASRGKSDPSLADVIKMVHPRPNDNEQNALFGFLLGKDHDKDALPPLVKEIQAFAADNTNPLPDTSFRNLTNYGLTKDHWKQIAINMPWNTLRMNLNLLDKHGVFSDYDVTEKVCRKLSNPEEVKKWNAFPYQLLTTFQNVGETLPMKVRLALQDALDVALGNVPALGNSVAICVDVSASMDSPVTSSRPGQPPTKTSCRDVGALMASALGRVNPEAAIISFATSARVVPNFNPRDSVMSNSRLLANESLHVGHGTNVSAAMNVVNQLRNAPDLVIFIGDNQSWIDSCMGGSRIFGTPPVTAGWTKLKSRNKRAKVAEIVLGPYATTNIGTSSDKDMLNVGGFSDGVFDVLHEFVERRDNVTFADIVSRVEL